MPRLEALTPAPAVGMVTPLGNRASGQTFKHVAVQATLLASRVYTVLPLTRMIVPYTGVLGGGDHEVSHLVGGGGAGTAGDNRKRRESANGQDAGGESNGTAATWNPATWHSQLQSCLDPVR